MIGADGLHSAVRALAFAGEPDQVADLGLYVAIFGVPDRYGLDHEGLLYSVPGKTAAVFSAPGTGQAVAQFFFAAPAGRPLEFDYRDPGQQQKILASVFQDVGWQVPDLLGQLPAADDFYFDSVSQVRLDRWSSGRVALAGDAGYAAGPGGNGTGTAVVAAYVLAGELAAAGGATASPTTATSACSVPTSPAARSRPAAAPASLPRPPRRRSPNATACSACSPTSPRPGPWSSTSPPAPPPPSSCRTTPSGLAERAGQKSGMLAGWECRCRVRFWWGVPGR